MNIYIRYIRFVRRRTKGPSWDWGSIDKEDAEFELEDQPDGTFLVRESVSTPGK